MTTFASWRAPQASRWLARRLLFVGLAACALLMLGPYKGGADLVLPSDKAAHVVAWYCLTALLIAGYPNERWLRLFLGPVLIGAALELVQAAFGRDVELGDVVADALGTGLALAPFLPIWLRAGNSPRRRWKLQIVGLSPKAHVIAGHAGRKRGKRPFLGAESQVV